MEKLSVGWSMSTRWTDPPMLLIGIIPYAGVCGAVTGGFGFRIFQAFKSAGEDAPSLERIGWLLAGAAAPTILTWTWWNVLYHGLGIEPKCDPRRKLTTAQSCPAPLPYLTAPFDLHADLPPPPLCSLQRRHDQVCDVEGRGAQAVLQ